MISNLVSRRSESPVAPATGSGRVIPARVRPQTSQTCYHRNQQYSIVGLTNAAGTLVERYTYSAYGTLGIYAANGTVRTSSTYANRYTYTGREWDGELRLYHFRARWYDPATGGFVTRDPLGYVDGMSLYRGYFGVQGVDPSGHRTYAIDGTGADHQKLGNFTHLGYTSSESATYQFFRRSSDRGGYWGGVNTRFIGTHENIDWIYHAADTAVGESSAAATQKVKNKICRDYCISVGGRDQCADDFTTTCKPYYFTPGYKGIDIDLVGWSRGAVEAVNVAEDLNSEGCWCCFPTQNKNWWSGTYKWEWKQIKPVPVRFLGLFDPVSMHFLDSRLSNPTNVTSFTDFAIGLKQRSIPSNVHISAAIYRTANSVRDWPFQRTWYNVMHRHDYYRPVAQLTTHGQTGRDQFPAEWMIERATAAGVRFDE